MKRIGLFVAAAVIGAAAFPVAAKDPAVSALNFKVTAEGGHVNDDGAWLGLGQVTAPLNNDWGLQGEAAVANVDGDYAYGIAGHAFMRDPASHMIGAFGAYTRFDGIDLDVGRIGLEGEYYLSNITISANGGYQFGDGAIDDTGFGEVAATWYANEDFALSGGVAFDDDVALGHFGAEWLVGRGSDLSGLALRGDLNFGDNSYDSAMLGITYYIGQEASLKDRHRKQDPDSALLDLLNAVEAACGQQQTPVWNTKVAPAWAPPPTQGCEQIVWLP